MDRNSQQHQEELPLNTNKNTYKPLFQIPNEINQSWKSAFRLCKRVAEQENEPQQQPVDVKRQDSSSSTDINSSPLGNYFMINFKSFIKPRIEASKIVFSQNNPALEGLNDLLSQESQKSYQFKTLRNQELAYDLKKIMKDRSSLPLKDRKCCKCKKSHCLLLYCECFRSGQICQGCNCQSCMNTLEYSKERIQAIKRCLDTNPLAFVTQEEGKVSKGCKCRKSGCQKGYCQCFQQGKDCTSACICINCQNTCDHSREPPNGASTPQKLHPEGIIG